MKTLVLTTALIIFTTFAFSQTSSNKEKIQDESSSVSIEVMKNSQDHFTLVLKKEIGKKVSIKIKEENGSLIHQKNLRKEEKNTLAYDISELPEGKYRFEISSGKDMIYAKTLKKSVSTIAMID